MKVSTNLLRWMLLLFVSGVLLPACGDDDSDNDDDGMMTPVVEVPTTYTFLRNGTTSVSYSGQTDRLNQLSEIKALLKTADAGNTIDGQDLVDMFANVGNNGNGNFSFSSDRQLKSKTFELDHSFFEDLMIEAGDASVDGTAGTVAADGQRGLLTRGNGNTILVNENGWEYTQLIEKGLMGATFYFQMTEVYLNESRTGDLVNNTDLEDGKNYTAMEHHMDEGFGYFGVPVDFASNWPEARDDEAIFWGNYSNGRDGLLTSNDNIMTAFRTARAAIVANDYVLKNQQRDVLYQELEKVVAATAIHYINDVLSATNDGDQMHWLSESYAFVNALKYSPRRQVTIAEIENILDNNIGENFWNVTASGLNTAKDFLSTRYGLDSVKDDL